MAQVVQTPTNTAKKEIKLVVIDIDGTLLNSNNELTERVEKALKAAMAQGVQIAFATGKTRSAVEAILDRLNLKAPGIFIQGLVIYDADGKITHQQSLQPAIARQVITYAEDRGFSLLAYADGRILAKTMDEKLFDAMAKYHETIEVAGSLQNLLSEMPINKLVAVGNDARSVKALRWQLTAQVGGGARLVQAGIAEMVEILPPGASKGSALKILTKDLRIPAENVMAIGDAENDIEMIQFAGVGVAMGQADQKIKDMATYVAPTNDEDGVADALEKYVLPKPVKAPEGQPVAAFPEAEESPADVTTEDGAVNAASVTSSESKPS